MSVVGYSWGVSVDERGYFNFHLPFCPGEVVLRASAEGYVSTLKVLDIALDTLDIISNIQVVLFKLADPVPVVVGEENILETSGAAIIIIPEGATFLDENGNEVEDNVNAFLNFIDPSDDDFDDSPGRFVTDTGEELVSFGVLNLRFKNGVGDFLTPNGDIRIALVGSVEPGYKLWLLNSKGKWVEKISSPVIGGNQATGRLAPRNKRQTGTTDLGSFGTDDIGQWINCDRVPSASMCYIKTRVFDDISFTSEVVDNGVDTYKPKFLLKIGSSAPFQGLNLYRSPTFSPGQTCFEVRCGTLPNIHGFVSVITQETIGNGQSVPFPAIPIQLGHSALPSSIYTELGSLNYQVNTDETEAKLDFDSSPTGPLYEDRITRENSAPSDNSLWFARRTPVFTDNDFGSDVCYARVVLYQQGNGTNELLDQLLATSVWGNGPYNYADFIVHNSEFVYTPQGFACVRYRCSQPADMTTVYLDTFVTKENVTCYAITEFTPPILDPATPVHGFYGGVDEGMVREECLTDTDPEGTEIFVSCYFKQREFDGTDYESTG